MELEGYVERIVYQNKENGYCVLAVSNGTDETFVTGVFPEMNIGEYIRAEGEIILHPVYGEQMKAESFNYASPSDAASIEMYLGSGAIKGIGPTLAKRIVQTFGDDSFRIMEEEPDKLAKAINGVSKKKAQTFSAQLKSRKDVRDAMMFLQNYRISQNLALKIYEKYGQKLYGILKQNPYQLAEDIDGVGFRTADEIAARSGIAVSSEFRIRSGMLYVLDQSLGNGHTCLPEEELLEKSKQLLDVDEEALVPCLKSLIIDRKAVARMSGDVRYIYTSNAFFTEMKIAAKLKDLNVEDSAQAEVLDKKIRAIEAMEKIELDDCQRQAVRTAVTRGLCVITGGPGTGKTTTIKTVIRFFMSEGIEIQLAAPTGRAAKRMSEATGYEARTIHRLLEVSGNEEKNTSFFGRGEDNPLETDVVIIDESSMVDIFLMNSLLRAMVPGQRLILVGDVNQLPSVGPGNVLKDIIGSETFPVVRLERIFRQAADSDIIVNAHRIHRGETVLPKPGSRDFLFIPRDNAGNIVGATITLLSKKLPDYVHADWHEIQVLTPMRKGVLGVEQLNNALQAAINPADMTKQETLIGDVTFREGDKVMQVKNNYQKEWQVLTSFRSVLSSGTGVFNGDCGVIAEINQTLGKLTVEFEEHRRAEYTFKEAEELELAYAVTIHKSQGSEYPAVILPLLTGPKLLMNRNLLYTAVTRAKSCVCIVGSVQTFQQMIDNDQEMARYSGLKERIREVYEPI